MSQRRDGKAGETPRGPVSLLVPWMGYPVNRTIFMLPYRPPREVPPAFSFSHPSGRLGESLPKQFSSRLKYMAPPVRLAAVSAIAGFAIFVSACGGGGSSSSPTSPTPTPLPSGTSACGVISGQTAPGVAIVNGTSCSPATASVAQLYLVGSDGFAVGYCSGTVISPTAVLTAAHCLDKDVAKVRVGFGAAKEFTASSFQASPNYNGNTSNSIDVGVVIVPQAMGQPIVPILSSRDAVVGEAAIIAGFGQDLFGQSLVLRAGSTTISSVDSVYLQNNYGGSSSSACSGDSGGPMLVSVGGTWAIAGVTSGVSGNCVAGANFYINVRNSSARAFILANVPDVTQK